jgi:hypothetical protein
MRGENFSSCGCLAFEASNTMRKRDFHLAMRKASGDLL